jgi:hypothetical protein
MSKTCAVCAASLAFLTDINHLHLKVSQKGCVLIYKQTHGKVQNAAVWVVSTLNQ